MNGKSKQIAESGIVDVESFTVTREKFTGNPVVDFDCEEAEIVVKLQLLTTLYNPTRNSEYLVMILRHFTGNELIVALLIDGRTTGKIDRKA